MLCVRVVVEAPATLAARALDAWVRGILRHRWIALGLTFVLTLGFGAVAASLPVMTTIRDFLPPDTPGFASWDEARSRFGGDEVAMIALEADDHFTPAGRARLAAAAAALEAHPFVERVVSPSAAQRIAADPDDAESIVVVPVLPEDASESEARASALAAGGVGGSLFSRDGRVAVLFAQVVANRDDVAVRPGVREEVERRAAKLPGAEVQRRHEGGLRRLLEVTKQTVGAELVELVVAAGYPRETVRAVGFPILFGSLVSDSQDNIRVLFPATLVVLLVVMFVLLRRPVDAFLPMLCVGPAVIWAIALGGLIFGRITLITSVAPAMVLVVGVSDVVHLVTQFRHEQARGLERALAIRVAFREVGAACLLTSLTTLIGFGSMVLLPLPPSRELGVFAGLGVLTAFLLSFVLTPIALSFERIDLGRGPSGPADRIGGFLGAISHGVARHPRPVVAVSFVLTTVVAVAAGFVEFENVITRKLSADHPTRLAARFMEETFGSSAEIEVLIDAGRPDGLKDPAVLGAVRALDTWIERDPRASEAVSLADVVARIHETIGGEAGSFPDDAATIAQDLLLFEVSGGESLGAFVDETFQHARMTVRVPEGSAEAVVAFAEAIDAEAARRFPAGARAEANGIGLQSARLGPRLLETSMEGFAGALVLIAALMTLLFRSIKVGVLSILPNVFPVAAGLVGAALIFEQVDVDALTSMAICIGIAVDDTIHFLSRFRIERARGLDREAAVQVAMMEAGYGILRTTVILVFGFVVLLWASYAPIRTMGFMLPATLITAVLLDLSMVPAMARLGWLEPRGAAPRPDPARSPA